MIMSMVGPVPEDHVEFLCPLCKKSVLFLQSEKSSVEKAFGCSCPGHIEGLEALPPDFITRGPTGGPFRAYVKAPAAGQDS
jgi:hypothetical protein